MPRNGTQASPRSDARSVAEKTPLIAPIRTSPCLSRPPPNGCGCLESLFEIGDEVVDVLDADGEADEAVADAEGAAAVRGDRGMGHDGRVLRQRLDAAER